MAESGKKQGGKTSAKKPASFSRDAAKTSAAKKPVNKKKTTTKKKTTAKNTKKAPKNLPKKTEQKIEQKTTGFEEFETLKLEHIEKADSKIIVRDVERETPIEAIVEAPKTTEAPKAVEEPLPVFHPVSRPRPVAAPAKVPAKELKQQEIDRAIKTAAKMPVAERRRRRSIFGEFGLTRVVLATACITTAVFAIAYFVNMASSDMSIQVAAAQSGIDAKYPSYIPRGFELSDVTSGSGRVTMHYKSDEGEFTLTEEASSWDSEALLNNFIKSNYNNDYTVIREQGLTLYMGGNWEAWVNGGMLYKLNVISGNFTKKQLKTIATSL